MKKQFLFILILLVLSPICDIIYNKDGRGMYFYDRV